MPELVPAQAGNTLDRLATATNAGNSALSQTFGYDAAHNMVSNSLVGTYSYPAQGPSAIRPHAATQAGPYALSYDAAGNMTRKLGGRSLPCRSGASTDATPA